MKSFFLFLSLSVASISFAQTAEYVPGEVLVKFKPNTSVSRFLAHRLLKAKEVKQFPQLGVALVRLPQGLPVADAVSHYKGFVDLEYVEPNYLSYLNRTPNDTNFGRQYAPAKIHADKAWDLSTGSSNVIIAVIDTGADLTHPDLQGKLVPGFDFADNDSDPTDHDSHGTHCVGNIGARTNNSRGIAGIAWECRVMPLKVFPSSGGGAPISATMAALTFAADKGVKVISMSLGGYHFSQAYQEAINYAWNKGAVIVAAAGNDNISIPHYPSDYDNVISVGATDSNDQKADFSNFGQGVDVAAPGVDIYSTVVGGGYADFSGTSMSCPVVAGVAGLCFAYGGPATTNTAVRAAIEGTSDKVGPWLRLGRVNAFKALQKVSPPAIFTFGPTSADKHSGGTATGNVASVQHSDNSRFSISSAKTSLGPEAAIAISMKITQPLDKLVGLRFDMEAHAVAGATNTLFLYNWNTQGFEYFRSLPLSGSDQVRSFNIEPGSGYISPAGEVKMISRANVGGSHGRAGKPFTFRIDHVSLTGSFRTN